EPNDEQALRFKRHSGSGLAQLESPDISGRTSDVSVASFKKCFCIEGLLTIVRRGLGVAHNLRDRPPTQVALTQQSLDLTGLQSDLQCLSRKRAFSGGPEFRSSSCHVAEVR